ncbi:MAG: hypothetical protein GXY61_14570 [Lentisphaerae bacterium]|nr:hypothetical protein [Lentisphaerota bacterium]
MSKASTPSPVRTSESSARCMVCAAMFHWGLTHWRVLTIMFILFAGALGLIHRATKNLTVGLQLEPNPTGSLTCTWIDQAGQSHDLGFQSTASGKTTFQVPCHASLFRFVFTPSSQPYHVKSLNLYHLPLFNAQWLNNMVNPDQRVYRQQYMSPNDTLEIISTSHETSLAYPRFFTLLLQLLRTIHVYTRPVFIVLNALALTVLIASIAYLWSLSRKRVPDVNQKASHLFQRPFVLGLALVSCVLFGLPIPVHPITSGCDPSWNWVLNHLAFNPVGIGTVAFFTYGPLGFTLFPLPIGLNAWFALLCNLYHAFLFLLTLLVFYRSYPGARLDLWGVVLCTYLLPATEWKWGILLLFLFLTCCFTPSPRRREVALLAACAGPVMVYASLLKFSLAIIIICSVIMVVLYLVLFNRGAILAFLAPLSISFLISLCLARQSLFPSFAAMATWASISWEIATGYNTAMVTQASSLELAIPFILLAGFIGAVLPFKRLTPRHIGLLMLVAPLVFFAFKYSVTRAGLGVIRALAYVSPCVLSLVLLFCAPSWRKQMRRLLACYLVVGTLLSVVIGYFYGAPMIGFSAQNLFNTFSLNTSIQRAKAESVNTLESVKLPSEWTALIGTNTFTSYPVEMTYAPANALNFVPFPVVQGYAAYSMKLDQLGAQLFSPPEAAPEWVLCAFSALDHRNTIIDTPAVWRAVRDHYSPVTQSDTSILLQKKKGAEATTLQCLGTAQIMTGGWLDLSATSSNITHLAIDWSPTLFGKLSSLIFRNTCCSVTIEREDGETRRWRFIPDTAKNPFTTRIPFDDREFVESWQETSEKSLKIRRILFDCENPLFYNRTLKATFFRDKSTASSS